ncbi:MAG: hypothetical protein QXV22_03415 [Thermoplasmataceae archaeon]
MSDECRDSIIKEAALIFGSSIRIAQYDIQRNGPKGVDPMDGTVVLFEGASLFLPSLLDSFSRVDSIIFVEPEYSRDLLPAFPKIECPTLIISRRTEENVAYINALKFHDHIAGSILKATMRGSICENGMHQALREISAFVKETYGE